MGFNDNTLILCASDHKIDIQQLAQTTLNLGCRFAINCDGGGSCHLQQGNNILKRSYRKNANKAKTDLFVSLHANAAGSNNQWASIATGWKIFIYDKGSKAQILAKSIQAESIPFLGLKDRGVRVENFQVRPSTKMPAALIEHGFMTCKADCDLLKTTSFRSKCALADAKGIVKHLSLQ